MNGIFGQFEELFIFEGCVVMICWLWGEFGFDDDFVMLCMVFFDLFEVGVDWVCVEFEVVCDFGFKSIMNFFVIFFYELVNDIVIFDEVGLIGLDLLWVYNIYVILEQFCCVVDFGSYMVICLEVELGMGMG